MNIMIPQKKVRVNFDKIYDVVKELANVLLTIQAEGDYAPMAT